MDSWYDLPLIQTIHHNLVNQVNIDSCVADYLIDGVWHFFKDITSLLPNINLLIDQVTLPLDFTDDCMVWNHNVHKVISLKEDFFFKNCIPILLSLGLRIYGTLLFPHLKLSRFGGCFTIKCLVMTTLV